MCVCFRVYAYTHTHLCIFCIFLGSLCKEKGETVNIVYLWEIGKSFYSKYTGRKIKPNRKQNNVCSSFTLLCNTLPKM